MATGPDGSAGRGGVPGTALTMRHERVRVPERRSAFVATLRDRVPPGIRVHPTVLLLRRMAGCLLWGAIGVVTDACRIVAGSCRLVFGPHHRVETGLCLAALRAETTRTDAGGPVCCTARVYNRLRDCSTAEFELVLHGATKAAGLQVTGRLPLDGRTHHDVEFIVSGGSAGPQWTAVRSPN